MLSIRTNLGQSVSLQESATPIDGYVLAWSSATGGWVATAPGGGGSPGGGTTQIQYNNAGAFGGIAGLTYDGTNLTATIPILASGGLVLENRTSDPGAPVSGQIWLRTDL